MSEQNPESSQSFADEKWWEQCRHRDPEPQTTPGHQFDRALGFSCLLAIEEDSSGGVEVGVAGCKEANCPYTDRPDVP